MKEMFDLTLLRRVTLCIRRVLREKEESEEGEGILTAIHHSPLLCPSFTDDLTGDNSDGVDQCPHHDCQQPLATPPHSLMLLLIQSLVRATRW